MLLDRKLIKLNTSQLHMIKSGWGDSTFNSNLENITYISDGLNVKGYVAYPEPDDRKYPCIIWCRGGFGNLGALDDFTAYGILGQIASWGYIVFAPQYRGNKGGKGEDLFGGDDVNDILNLTGLAEEFDSADTNIWGIEGWSRGGMMTSLTLTKSNIFKAAVVINGITDLKKFPEQSPFMKNIYKEIKSKIPDFDNFAKERSINNFPEKLNNTNLLIIQGDKDERVFPNNSIELSDKLTQLGYDHKIEIIKDGDHFLRKKKAC